MIQNLKASKTEQLKTSRKKISMTASETGWNDTQNVFKMIVSMLRNVNGNVSFIVKIFNENIHYTF